MINGRFSIQIHIVSLLAISSQAITSEFIASSVNCNPVLVRKELTALKKAGIIVTQEGKNGGAKLIKNPNEIYLDQLFVIAYGGADIFAANKNQPNPLCSVGRNISSLMKKLNAEVELSLIYKLHQTSIGNLLKQMEA